MFGNSLRPYREDKRNNLIEHILYVKFCLSLPTYWYIGGNRDSYAVRAYIWKRNAYLMDQDAIMRAVRRISHEILERNKGFI